MKKHEKGSLVYYSHPVFDRFPEIAHIISTRLGGESEGPYRELNLGMHVGDDDEAVRNNRSIVCKAAGMDPCTLTTANQVHGTNIAVITKENQGRGALHYGDSIPQTDGLVTNTAGIAIMVLVADCAVVSFLDPEKRVIALAHASWRGTLHRIVQKTVNKMIDTFGCDPKNIAAGISPSIGPCCYEVREDVIGVFQDTFPGEAHIFIRNLTKGSAYLDLWTANYMQLLEMGLGEENIETAEICTSCRTDLFYSYRAENKKTGRFGALMMIKRQ